ncbi:MAG: efflux RND transporter permease subunit, partial [Rhodobacteraceae bacterium]|nr:efflux RND transporter permease subunit [Paracoccaceae bacterium]
MSEVKPHSLGIAGGLTRGFITSPLTPLFLMAAFVFGIVALLALPREEEPQISVPMVDIHVQANGLKAEDAAKLVTEPLETIVKGIDGVEHVYSQTSDDRVMVTARFLVGTPSDNAILRVHDKVRANIDRIPVGVPEPQIVGRGIDDVAILSLTLAPKPEAADRITANDLTRIARELRTEIAKIPDVGLSYIVGETSERLRIAPDPERLALFGMTLQQLAGKVTGANTAFPTGFVRDEGQQVMLVAGETLSSPEEIANLLLTTRDGRPVYVRDVADVSFADDGEEHLVATVTKGEDGAVTRVPAVTLAVAKRAGSNAVTVAEEILHRVHMHEGRLIPEDIAVEITRDYGESANEKANELLYHLALATVSIIALVWVAIGRREAFVVAIVIPVTILLTLFASNVMGYTLNRVSLFALIFSIGILVDDAIVVIENIARHWAMADGRDRKSAAIDAVAEVGNPTIVATLTVVAALLPMLFVSGLMGPYMSPIPANASAAMIFSFFVAVIITPWLMMRIAGKAHAHDAEAKEGALGRFYRRVARPVIATRKRAMTFAIGVAVATVLACMLFATKTVTVKLLPFDNKSEFQIVADLPEGASLEETERVLMDAADRLSAIDEITSMEVYAGTAAPFNFNGLVRHYYLRAAPELGDLQVTLEAKHHRHRSSHTIALQARELLKDIAAPEGTSIKVVEAPPGPPVLATLLAEIYGPTAEERRETARIVRELYRKVPYIVDDDLFMGEAPPRLRVSIDQDSLEFYKVEQQDVYDTLRTLLQGSRVGYSHRGEGRDPIEISVRLPKEDLTWTERLLSTPIPANAIPGERGVVELGDVVRVTEEKGSHVIYRRDGRFAEMVLGELAGQYEAPIYGMMAVQDEIKNFDWAAAGLDAPMVKLYGQPVDESHLTLLWDGEWEITWVTFRDMGAAFIVAIIGIYILVVAQFGSFKLPLVILTPVPLTLIGIMLGHWLFGAQFTATSMIGFIALAGIIVRNSILLVDFIRHGAQEGASLRETLLTAGAVRFKPILLTAIAAMIGASVIL